MTQVAQEVSLALRRAIVKVFCVLLKFALVNASLLMSVTR
jgi:hypothetical protein